MWIRSSTIIDVDHVKPEHNFSSEKEKIVINRRCEGTGERFANVIEGEKLADKFESITDQLDDDWVNTDHE
jgi:hypothetical protein